MELSIVDIYFGCILMIFDPVALEKKNHRCKSKKSHHLKSQYTENTKSLNRVFNIDIFPS